MRVELVNIGTELLMGFVVNTHAAYFGRKLNAIGATLTRQVCVNDTAEDIREVLNQAIERADLVITSGGLGPTSDDITRSLVCELFGLESHIDPRTMENIETRFRRRNSPITENVRSEALVPKNSTVFYNNHGTAPGLAIPLSAAHRSIKKSLACKWLIMLPGPPRELYPMFEEQVLPFLLREFHAQFPILDCRVLKVVGIGESTVEQMIQPVLNEMKDVEIGYCARSGEVDVRIVVRGDDSVHVRQLAGESENKIRQVLGDAIFGSGDETLEQVVVEMLRQKRKFVTTAESCTGGHLANRITLVPGSSEVFREGWVTYSNEAKAKLLGVSGHLIVEHGAVSEPVVRAMAEGALHRAKSDYALAITGIAGPGGGTEEKPVGTVWIVLASKKGTQAERFQFYLDRETFKFAATQAALNMLRKELVRST